MTLKSRLTELLHYIRDEQLAFNGRLSAAECEEIGEAHSWSAKDNLVHSVIWADRLLDDLELVASGDPPPEHDYGDFVDANRAIFEQYQNEAWETVHTMIAGAYERIDAYVERIGEEGLQTELEWRDQATWRAITGNYVLHPAIHMWEYLNAHGYIDTLAAIFGESYAERLIALDDGDDWRGTVYYNLACQYALTGNSDGAINSLAEALRLNPDLLDWSQQDSDLDSIRAEAGYKALFD